MSSRCAQAPVTVHLPLSCRNHRQLLPDYNDVETTREPAITVKRNKILPVDHDLKAHTLDINRQNISFKTARRITTFLSCKLKTGLFVCRQWIVNHHRRSSTAIEIKSVCSYGK